MSVGGLPELDHDAWIVTAMSLLKARRDGKGHWKSYPYYYTLLALSEFDHPHVLAELQYTASTCEKLLRRQAGDDKYAQRRRLLAERVLAKC